MNKYFIRGMQWLMHGLIFGVTVAAFTMTKDPGVTYAIVLGTIGAQFSTAAMFGQIEEGRRWDAMLAGLQRTILEEHFSSVAFDGPARFGNARDFEETEESAGRFTTRMTGADEIRVISFDDATERDQFAAKFGSVL